MRKILALLLVVVLCIILSGCAGESNETAFYKAKYEQVIRIAHTALQGWERAIKGWEAEQKRAEELEEIKNTKAKGRHAATPLNSVGESS